MTGLPKGGREGVKKGGISFVAERGLLKQTRVMLERCWRDGEKASENAAEPSRCGGKAGLAYALPLTI